MMPAAACSAKLSVRLVVRTYSASRPPEKFPSAGMMAKARTLRYSIAFPLSAWMMLLTASLVPTPEDGENSTSYWPPPCPPPKGCTQKMIRSM